MLKIPTVTVAPTNYPISLQDVKRNIGITIDDDSQDLSIFESIKSLTNWIEEYLNRSLITRTLTLDFDELEDDLVLAGEPIQTITSITYYDTTNTQQTLSTDYYALDTSSAVANIYLKYGYSWPAHLEYRNSVTVTYIAGYGDTAASVPEAIRKAMLIIMDNWLRYQATSASGLPISTIPYAAEQLLRPFRCMPGVR